MGSRTPDVPATSSSPVTRHARLISLTLLVATAACPISNAPTPAPAANLAWDGPKLYNPATSGTAVAGMGINSTVDVLPAAPLPISVQVTKTLINNGSVAVAAGYQIVDSVVAMHFVSTGTTAGFVPINAPPVAIPAMRGPALKPGDSLQVSFSFVVPACGVYRETLHADVGNVVTETTKQDNRAVHFFAAQGTQRVQIAVVEANNGASIWHSGAGPMPKGVIPLPPLPYNAYTFTITAPAGSTFFYNYYQHPINGVYEGVSAFTGPAPNTTPVAGPTTIQFQLQAVKTHNVAINDILMDVGFEDMHGQVTAITADGCFIRQETRTITVLHP